MVPETVNYAKWGKEKRYDVHPSLLDIHVPRMVEAHRRVLNYMRDTALLHSGMLRVERFLGGDAAQEIKRQALGSVIKDGQSPGSRIVGLQQSSATEAMIPIWEVVHKAFQEKLYKEALQLFLQNSYLQHLLNCPDDEDEQKRFHSDTFFPCLKFWYFPHDVKITDGPFWYVPMTPELTDGLIEWHIMRVADLKSGTSEEWRGAAHREGSFRISERELAELGYKPEPVTVSADTLVVANVFGFHRRGDTESPSHRVSIHGSIRISNPFVH